MHAHEKRWWLYILKLEGDKWYVGITSKTPEEGRKLAIAIARHTVKSIQPDMKVLHAGRPDYATNPDRLTAAAQVVAIEFQTIAAANNYWK